jgi:hypothetical protein
MENPFKKERLDGSIPFTLAISSLDIPQYSIFRIFCHAFSNPFGFFFYDNECGTLILGLLSSMLRWGREGGLENCNNQFTIMTVFCTECFYL